MKKRLKNNIKNFIKKQDFLYRIVFLIWSFFCLIRARIIFKKLKHKTPKNNLKVIILGLRTIPTTNLVYFDAVFGHAFEKLGCEVKMLYCDGLLDSCDADTIFRNQNSQCFLCKKFNKSLKKSLNLDYLSFKQYVGEKEIEKIKKIVSNLKKEELLNYKYSGVNIGSHAQSSAIRYFLFGKLDLNDSDQEVIFRKKLVYAMIMTKIAFEIDKKENPSIIFTLHGVYSTWGPFAEYFKIKNKEVVIYSNMPPRFGHFIFNRNTRSNELVSKEGWKSFSKRNLLKEEEDKITKYFQRKVSGKNGEQLMFRENFEIKNKKEVLKSLFKKGYKKRFVMYPNLAWDVAIEGKISEIFEDVFSWIDETIEFFKNKKEYQLVIKPHPAELIWEGANKSIYSYIKERHGFIPPNITLLKPNVPLNAYKMINDDSVCLTYNGTIGLELSALGIPVIAVANRVHYVQAKTVKQVDSLQEYLKVLNDPGGFFQFARDNKELAKKYAYFYFFKSFIRIPFYRADKWSKIDWKVLFNTKKLLSEDGNIIKVCQKIIKKEDIYL